MRDHAKRIGLARNGAERRGAIKEKLPQKGAKRRKRRPTSPRLGMVPLPVDNQHLQSMLSITKVTPRGGTRRKDLERSV
jgi:hypothetical protein